MNQVTAQEARKRLEKGNRVWREEGGNGEMSALSVRQLLKGQSPYAVILTCSDSRVIPEAVFHAGAGDLFVIRTAGNTIGDEALGSVEYAVEHLGCQLVLVLGHTNCGAVAAAMEEGEARGYLWYLLDPIREVIGDEKDPYLACWENVRHSADKLRKSLDLAGAGALVQEAVFKLEDGTVEFLE